MLFRSPSGSGSRTNQSGCHIHAKTDREVDGPANTNAVGSEGKTNLYAETNAQADAGFEIACCQALHQNCSRHKAGTGETQYAKR